jgi:hypothetical protein
MGPRRYLECWQVFIGYRGQGTGDGGQGTGDRLQVTGNRLMKVEKSIQISPFRSPGCSRTRRFRQCTAAPAGIHLLKPNAAKFSYTALGRRREGVSAPPWVPSGHISHLSGRISHPSGHRCTPSDRCLQRPDETSQNLSSIRLKPGLQYGTYPDCFFNVHKPGLQYGTYPDCFF